MFVTNNTFNHEGLNKYGKCLIIDDEVADHPHWKNDFQKDLELSDERIIFVSNYEDALETIKKETQVTTIFLDSKIRKDNHSLVDYEETPHGIRLIPQINEYYKYTSIYVYSAYVERNYLQRKTRTYNNVLGYFGKIIDEATLKQLFIEGTRHFYERLSKNYSYIDPLSTDVETLVFLDRETAKLNFLFKKTAEDIIRIGNILNIVKEKLEYGLFTKWLKKEFAMTNRTAQRMMKAASTFSLDTVSNLNVSPTILYELSKDSIPEPVVDKIIAKAKQGEKITVQKIKTITDDHQLESKDTLFLEQTNENTEAKILWEPEAVEVQSSLISIEPKQKIVGIVRRQDTWELGKHLLFCGEPNSDRFIKLLPPKIALNLAFPLNSSWIFSEFKRARSNYNFFTEYRSELEPELLGISIETTIKLTTDLNDTVSICFLPDPIILEKAHELGCVCFIAEPDRLKCEALVELWEI